MTQDNLTVEKIKRKLDTTEPFTTDDVMFLLKQVESLKINKGGKTNFDEVAELKRQVKSQDEITAVLHIVNAELGRRVESQKEEIASGKRCVNAAQGWLNDSNVPLHGRVIRATATLDNFPLPKEE